MSEAKNMLNEIMENLDKFSKKTPEQMKAFHGFMEAAEKPGKIDAKTKHLIALGCSITSHCEWCIHFHVKAALDNDASEDEILETIWVAVLMGGGPALMYSQIVLDILEQSK